MIADHLHSQPKSIAADHSFIATTTWLREEVPVASDLRTSVRMGTSPAYWPAANGDGVVFIPAHRTQKEAIQLEPGDYDLRFEDGRAARATVTRSYIQDGFLVAFFTLALPN